VGAAAAAAAAGLTVAGGKLALGAVDFRKNALIGLEAFVGSTAAAGVLYEKALDWRIASASTRAPPLAN